ncbi:MAG: HAD family hydrolase [Actinobacteria bacterium]|nr:MAG: HAD family hydrolase [Actinomycetota bacterium]
MVSRRAVFLDRDGVIVEDVGYLASPDRLRVLPGVPGALSLLKKAGLLRVVVTNQSGIARGYFTEDDLVSVHAELLRALAASGAGLDAIYYCPHLENGSRREYAAVCEGRKPGRAMLDRAASDLDIDLAESFLVGDTLTDIEAGKAAGCRTILVGQAAAAEDCGADASAEDLRGAAQQIIEWTRSWIRSR